MSSGVEYSWQIPCWRSLNCSGGEWLSWSSVSDCSTASMSSSSTTKQADTISVFDLPNPNLDSGLIQRNRPFSARIRIRECSESSFDADPLAKPEALSF